MKFDVKEKEKKEAEIANTILFVHFVICYLDSAVSKSRLNWIARANLNWDYSVEKHARRELRCKPSDIILTQILDERFPRGVVDDKAFVCRIPLRGGGALFFANFRLKEKKEGDDSRRYNIITHSLNVSC